MRIKNKKDIINKPELLPESAGIYKFHSKDEILYISKTSSLRRSITRILSSNPENDQILKLISLTKKVSWEAEDSIFKALLKEKIELNKKTPQFNSLIKTHSEYSYLKINFQKVPYFMISEDTMDDLDYAGPFFNRFLILDFIAALSELMKYPECDNENYPCYRFKDGTCSGWCLKDSAETAEMIVQNYLLINNNLLEQLKNRRKDYFNALDFLKEDKLKNLISTIQKYYEYIKFFHTIKHINMDLQYDNFEIKIQTGQIESCILNNEKFFFPIVKTDYRQNEFLAIDKQHLAESWIIYSYLKKKYSQKIDNIYLESSQEILELLGFTK